ncbi:MAG: hypothetical protein SGI92_09850 [Bryobacteraceae bacterium]|nr:hypothetical protein [Bryobacteraceae bacterium]
MQRLTLLLLAVAGTASATEIATGKMLGKGYDARAFYTRSAGKWVKTYTGPQYKPEAAGRLMNLRIGQAVVHDEWLTEASFDPEAHTTRVIAALDAYKQHGILAINVSLQGANPEYQLSNGVVKRDRHYKLGPGKGMHTSAFRPDGSLKPEWMSRTLRLARELDRRGMILNLIYFYGYQDEIFPDTTSIDKAAVNATDSLIDNKLRNVIIEIANESDGAAYDHDKYIHLQMGKLIQLIRSRFTARKAGYTLPISASTLGGNNMRVYEGVQQYADYTAIHGNHLSPEAKAKRLAELAADPSVPGPIYMNEDNNGRDNNGRDTTLANLKLELAACDAVFNAGGSWGYMPWRQLQIFPFRHIAPAASATVRDDMPVDQRDPAYFKAVLDHIASRVLKSKP